MLSHIVSYTKISNTMQVVFYWNALQFTLLQWAGVKFPQVVNKAIKSFRMPSLADDILTNKEIKVKMI